MRNKLLLISLLAPLLVSAQPSRPIYPSFPLVNGAIPTKYLPGALGTLSTWNGSGLTNLPSEYARTNDAGILLSLLAFNPEYDLLVVRQVWESYAANTIAGISTYTSWFEGVGAISNAFDTVVLQVTNWTTNKPTIFRAVLRSQEYYYAPGGTAAGVTNPTTWPILADSGLVGVSLTNNTVSTLRIPLSYDGSSTSKLFIQISSDGRFVPMSGTTIAFDTNLVAFTSYATTGTTNPASVATTSLATRFQVQFGNSNSLVNDFTFTTTTSNLVSEIVSATASSAIAAASVQSPVVSLSTIYASQGDEYNVYFRDVIRTRDLSSLDVDVTCGEGDQYADFFTITPTTSTNITRSFSLAVLDATNTLTTWTGSLNVAAGTNGQGVTRKVLIIGDSTTAGGQVITELTRKAGTNGFELIGVGTQGSGTNSHEGHSGWNVSTFYSGAGSPMTNGTAFDFNFYLTNNAITLASNDWVLINLGINDIFNYTTDATAYAQITNHAYELTQMVTNIHTAVPGVRVAVAQIIGPANSQDAFGNNYASGQTLARYRRNRFQWNEYFGTNGVSGATILPLNYCLDGAHNFPSSYVAANSRSTNTVFRLTNGVHPDLTGYYQIADAIYAFLKWFEQ